VRPAGFDLDMYQGDEFSLRLEFVVEEESDPGEEPTVIPMDLSGVTEVRAQIRVTATASEVLASLICEIEDVPGGVVTLFLAGDDVTDLPRAGVWDLQFDYVSGSTRTWLMGGVQVFREVTR
jgi:hypothetical protein